MSQSRKYSFRAKVAVGGLAASIALIAAEILLHVIHARREATASTLQQASAQAYDNDGMYYGSSDTFAQMEFNSYLGYIPKANYTGNGYHTNNHHCRYCDDFPSEKPSGEIRVFITGGSTAWGAGVDQDSLYSTIIEDRLRRFHQTSKIRVITAGVGAYVSTNERILITNRISRLSPDIIVMMSGWNDIAVCGYLGESVLESNDYLGAGAVLGRYHAHYAYPENTSFDDTLKPPEFDSYRLKLHFCLDRAIYNARFGAVGKLDEVLHKQLVPAEDVVRDLLQNVHAVADLAKRQGFRLVFYLQPTLYNTQKQLSNYERGLLRRYPAIREYNSRVYSRYRQKLPIEAREEGYLFVDGDDAIAGTERTVFADHVHFGDRGNRLIADHLSTVLHRLLPADALDEPRP